MRNLSILLLAAVLAAQVQAGEVTGTVTLQSATKKTPAARKDVRAVYPDLDQLRSKGLGGTGVTQEVANVVVFLEGKGLPTAPRKAVMSQENKIFKPHVLPIVSGSTVEFPNDDPFFHHIFSPAPDFEFSHYRKPEVKRMQFSIQKGNVPTVIELLCGIHTQMNAFVVVLPNGCFSTTDHSGKYAIKNVPPGTYTMKAWHPRTQPRLFELGEVSVRGGELVKDIVLK